MSEVPLYVLLLTSYAWNLFHSCDFSRSTQNGRACGPPFSVCPSRPRRLLVLGFSRNWSMMYVRGTNFDPPAT
ncbi:hypothetical protein T484DRAFT_1952410 [Baffinella frigidus]|nr:hypothetical protein T484DRAFT_1952410 [Cryptophyta sp. CCMP2293]